MAPRRKKVAEVVETPMENYAKLKVVDLKILLGELGLSTKGRKAELVRRLEESDERMTIREEEPKEKKGRRGRIGKSEKEVVTELKEIFPDMTLTMIKLIVKGHQGDHSDAMNYIVNIKDQGIAAIPPPEHMSDGDYIKLFDQVEKASRKAEKAAKRPARSPRARRKAPPKPITPEPASPEPKTQTPPSSPEPETQPPPSNEVVTPKVEGPYVVIIAGISVAILFLMGYLYDLAIHKHLDASNPLVVNVLLTMTVVILVLFKVLQYSTPSAPGDVTWV